MMQESEINSFGQATEFAATVFAEERSNQFFIGAARELFAGVLSSFIISGAAWTFRDVSLALSSKEQLREVLDRTPETRHLIEKYLQNERTFTDIMVTLTTGWQSYKPTDN